MSFTKRKYGPFAFSAFKAAATTGKVLVDTLQPAAIILTARVSCPRVFKGPAAITAITVSLGTPDNPTRYVNAMDVTRPPSAGNTSTLCALNFDMPNDSGPTPLIATLTTTGGNTNAVTDGVIEVSVFSLDGS